MATCLVIQTMTLSSNWLFYLGKIWMAGVKKEGLIRSIHISRRPLDPFPGKYRLLFSMGFLFMETHYRLKIRSSRSISVDPTNSSPKIPLLKTLILMKAEPGSSMLENSNIL